MEPIEKTVDMNPEIQKLRRGIKHLQGDLEGLDHKCAELQDNLQREKQKLIKLSTAAELGECERNEVDKQKVKVAKLVEDLYTFKEVDYDIYKNSKQEAIRLLTEKLETSVSIAQEEIVNELSVEVEKLRTELSLKLDELTPLIKEFGKHLDKKLTLLGRKNSWGYQASLNIVEGIIQRFELLKLAGTDGFYEEHRLPKYNTL